MTMQEAVIKNIDTDYSYQLAKRMEQFRSNEKLGTVLRVRRQNS